MGVAKAMGPGSAEVRRSRDLWAMAGQDIQVVAETGSGQDLVLWHGATPHGSALPPAYSLASSSAFEETWLSGSFVMYDLGCTADGCLSRQVPGGQGVVVRRTASATQIYQVPAGPQSAVLVVGPEEAFSVGVGGSIVHWRGDTREDSVLAERPWLRAVASRGAQAVWIVGDDSTVLRWDGRTFRRVPLPGLAGDLALSGVGYLSDGIWIVTGPAGIFRIRLGRSSNPNSPPFWSPLPSDREVMTLLVLRSPTSTYTPGARRKRRALRKRRARC